MASRYTALRDCHCGTCDDVEAECRFHTLLAAASCELSCRSHAGFDLFGQWRIALVARSQSTNRFCERQLLRDGTQDQIIGALSEALEQATGQLSCGSLEVIDAVSDVGAPATKIKCHVPIAIVWNRDAGR